MHTDQFDSCIEACKTCIDAAEVCANGGMREANRHAMADCTALSMDCMDICQLAIRYMERGSRMVSAACAACVEVCERCQEECDMYQMDYCRACAEACRTCALECQAVMALSHLEYNDSHDSSIAGLRN